MKVKEVSWCGIYTIPKILTYRNTINFIKWILTLTCNKKNSSAQQKSSCRSSSLWWLLVLIFLFYFCVHFILHTCATTTTTCYYREIDRIWNLISTFFVEVFLLLLLSYTSARTLRLYSSCLININFDQRSFHIDLYLIV